MTTNWIGDVSGDWSQAGNWDSGVAPTSADDVSIAATGASPYLVNITAGSVANSLTIDSAQAVVFEAAGGSLDVSDGSGNVTVDAGQLVLEGATNSVGEIFLSGGDLALAAGALSGAATIGLSGGELTALDGDVDASITFNEAGTVDAATGTTANFGAGGWTMNEGGGVITFGTSERAGTVVWNGDAGATFGPSPNTVDIADGVLRSGDAFGQDILSQDAGTTIEAAGTYDLNGFAVSLVKGPLSGAGTITNSSATAAPLTLSNGDFTGVINGPISVEVSANTGLTLEGVNTYSGGTTIDAGATLTLGGADGSVAGDIADGGELAIASTDRTSLGAITGKGALSMSGPGTLELIHTNAFSGGASVSGGTVVVANSRGFGTSALTFANAELVATGDATFLHKATFTGAVTLAAASGKTVTETWSNLTLDPASLTFGDSAHRGTLRWAWAGSATVGAVITFAAGTTVDATNLGFYASVAASVTVDAGATYDMNGLGTTIANLTDAGTITDSGAALTLGLSGTDSVTGTISGAIALSVTGGTTTLASTNSYTGGTTIAGGVLAVQSDASLGTGQTIMMSGGALVGVANVTLRHDLTTSGTVELGATASETLKLATANATIGAGRLVIGDSQDTGTVILTASTGLTSGGAKTIVEVADGTLRGGDGTLSTLLSAAAATEVDAGATLDLGGHAVTIAKLTGAGTLTNTGPAAHLTLAKASFSGVLAGAFTDVDVTGAATLTGNETFTGTARLFAGGDLTTLGTFAETVDFDGGGTLTLADPAHFTGVIAGFAAGSTIDLRNITTGATARVSYDTATKVLTVSDGTHTDTLNFSGALAQGNFETETDNAGGTDIVFQTATAVRLAQALASFRGASAATLQPSAAAPASGGASMLVVPRLG